MARDVRSIFADIDSFNPDQFVRNLTEDVVFRFGNGDPVVGRAEVRDAVAAFFGQIAGLQHHVLDVWEVGDTAIAKIDVEYRRTDGKHVTVPNVDILVFDGDLVSDWQIYIDLAPVFS